MSSALLKLDRFETEQNVYRYAVDLSNRTHFGKGGGVKQQYLTGYIRNLLVLGQFLKQFLKFGTSEQQEKLFCKLLFFFFYAFRLTVAVFREFTNLSKT